MLKLLPIIRNKSVFLLSDIAITIKINLIKVEISDFISTQVNLKYNNDCEDKIFYNIFMIRHVSIFKWLPLASRTY